MAGDLKAKVTFLADTKGLLKGVNAVESRFSKLSKGLQRHSATFLRTGAAMGAALGGLAAQGIAYGTTIDRMAEMTGAAHEEMSRLAYSAELYHGDAAMVEKGTRRLAKAMSDANDGLATYQRQFDKTGISVTDAEGNLRSVTDVLLDLSDYMQSGANDTEKLGAAYDLLGGRQSALIPWLKQGSAAIREQFKEADKLGLTLSGDLAKRMEKLGTSMKKVKIAMRGVSVVVADTLGPVIEDLAFKAIAAMMAFREWPDWLKDFAVKGTAAGVGGLLAAGALGQLAIALKALGVPAAAIATGLGALGTAAGFLAIQLGAAKLDEKLIEPMLAADRATRELTDANRRFLAAQKDLTAEMERTGMTTAEYDARLLWLYRDIYQNIEGAQNFEGVLDGTAAAMGETGEEADVLAGFMDKIRDAFNAAAASAEDAKTPFEEFLETMGLEQVTPLEDYTAAIASLNATLVDTPALMTALPFADVGEQIGALSPPLSDLELFLHEGIPGGLNAMLGAFTSTYGALTNLSEVTWKTLKKATEQGLKAVFNALLDEKFAELVVTYATEAGKITMASVFNPLNLLKLAALGAAFGTAKAAVAGISFDESAVVTRGGSLTGSMTIGDTIISPEAMKNLMKGDAGGTRITVNANFNGVYGGDESDAERDIDYLVERIELAFER